MTIRALLSRVAILMALSMMVGSLVRAEGLVFAVIPHSTSDGNFITAFEAAQAEAAQEKDRVLFLGEEGAGHPRYQNDAILKAIDLGVDGIALAPMDTELLTDSVIKAVMEQGIPLVLFESDFSPEQRELRAGFIGTDAVEFGRALGRLARQLKPEGGVVALMRNNLGHASINQRIQGIRMELAGSEGAPVKRLAGEGGWTEHPRTPWEAWDNYDRALSQLVHSLRDNTTDLFIAAGWWPQMAADYRQRLLPFKPLLASRQKIVLVGDAAPVQLQYLDEGLAHGNVSQDFAAMGRHAYHYLKRLRAGMTIPEITHTPVRIYSVAP